MPFYSRAKKCVVILNSFFPPGFQTHFTKPRFQQIHRHRIFKAATMRRTDVSTRLRLL